MSITVMKAALATLESMSQAMFDKGIALTDSEEYGIENFRAAIEAAEKQEPAGWWNPRFPDLVVQFTKPAAGGAWEPFYTAPQPEDKP